MNRWFVLVCALGLVTPLVAASPVQAATLSVRDLTLERLRAEFGTLPDTATVNGVTMTTSEALAMLGDLDARVNAVPGTDVGVATGPGCLPAGLVLAFNVGSSAATAAALKNIQVLGAPDPVCKGKVGLATADVNDGAFAAACVLLAGFVGTQGPGCHFNDFAAVKIAGEFSTLHFVFCLGSLCLGLDLWILDVGAMVVS